MPDNTSVKKDNERLRIHHAFWLSVFGLTLAAILAVFLVVQAGMKVESPTEVVAIVGLFTSVTGTLVGAFIGHQIGAAGAERERVGRHQAERVTRMALAHLEPGLAKQLMDTLRTEGPDRS